MKTARLLGIITTLLQNGKVTAPYLAEKFEVSRRTINRDIEAICKAGIPVTTIQGYAGGISIAEGYKLDKSVLTPEELEAIITGLKSLESVSSTSYTERLIEKLSSKKEAVFSLAENILIDLSSHYKTSLTQKIELIKQAINARVRISFRYYYKRGEAEKIIDPYLLVFKWGSWYVFGYSIERDDFRLYKLNRLWDLELTDQHFGQRELQSDKLDFDQYFTDEIALVALFEESVKYRLIEEYGVDSFTYTDQGKLLFKTSFTNQENLISWILSFGDTVEVLEPKELCSELKKHAKNMLEKYQ